MKLTSLQEVPFNVNLYVLSKESLLEKENRFGYTHQHFSLNHKSIIRLNQPPRKLPNTFEQLKKLGFENHFFLTNIKGRFDPKKVRKWQDDLWLFPLNQSKGETPEDAKIGGVAADGYVVEETSDN